MEHYILLTVLCLLSTVLLVKSHSSANIRYDFDLRCMDGASVVGVVLSKDDRVTVLCQNLTYSGSIRLYCQQSPAFPVDSTDMSFDKVCEPNEFIAGFTKVKDSISMRCCHSPHVTVLPNECELVTIQGNADVQYYAPIHRQNVVLQSAAVRNGTFLARFCAHLQTSRLNSYDIRRSEQGRTRIKRQGFSIGSSSSTIITSQSSPGKTSYTSTSSLPSDPSEENPSTNSTIEQYGSLAEAIAAAAAASAASGAAASAPPIPKNYSIGNCTTSKGISISTDEANFLFDQMIEMYGTRSVTYVEVMSETEFVFLMNTQILMQIIHQASKSSKSMTMKSVRGHKVIIVQTSILKKWPTQVGSNPCTCEMDVSKHTSQESDREISSGENEEISGGADDNLDNETEENGSGMETEETGSGMGDTKLSELWIGCEVIFEMDVFHVTAKEAVRIRALIVEMLQIEYTLIKYLKITTSSSFYMICHESIYEQIIKMIEGGTFSLEYSQRKTIKATAFEEMDESPINQQKESKFRIEVEKTFASIFEQTYMKFYMYSTSGARFSISSIVE